MVNICIPSRLREKKLVALVENLLRVRIDKVATIMVLETCKSSISSIDHNRIEYKFIDKDISFGEKIQYFAKKYNGRYVLFLSDDDDYDYEKLYEAIVYVNGLISNEHKLFLFNLFYDKNNYHPFSERIENAKLPFYLISSYIFKVNYSDRFFDINSIWAQNFLLVNYFTESYNDVFLIERLIFYKKDYGFSFVEGNKSFYRTLEMFSEEFSLKIAKKRYWDEFFQTQKNLIKAYFERRELGESDLNHFSQYRHNSIKGFLVFLFLLFLKVKVKLRW